MGCDIHAYAEKMAGGGWVHVADIHPFDCRDYGLFGFLAGVRNYSAVTPIAVPRGIPKDASQYVREQYEYWDTNAHSASWLLVSELASFDYDAMMEDRRCTRQTGPNCWDGGQTADPGDGKNMTYREFLGRHFFTDLRRLQDAGAERVVFWFDN